MKKTIYIFLFSVILVALSACTRNHGDIGIWFGTWYVENITIDGSTVNVDGNYFFQFQSKVFRVSLMGAHELEIQSFGTWEESEDGRLTVSFPDPDVYYIQMPGLETYNDFTVDATSHGRIVLTKVMSDGRTCSYSLKKQP